MKTKKNILILAYEAEIFNELESARLFQEKYQITFFCCDWFSSLNENNKLLIKNSRIKCKKIFDIKNEIIKINQFEDNSKIKIDFKNLERIEKYYLGEKISHIGFKDFALNNIDSPRNHYYHPQNKDILFKYYELILKKFETVVKFQKYDAIYSAGTSNLVRNILMSYARKNLIPFYSVRCRFGLTYLANCSMPNKNVNYFFKQGHNIKKLLIKNHDSKKLFNDSKPYSLVHLLFSLPGLFSNFFYKYFDDYKSRIKKSRPNYFHQKNTLIITLLQIKNKYNKYLINNYLLKNLKKKLSIIKSGKYIYFPLHVVPEGGVFDHNEYANEYILIEKISKLIPANYKIIVKPHIDLFEIDNAEAIYPLEWFKKIDKLKNVEIVSQLFNNNFLIKKCKTTISISGTPSLECAIFFNKISFTFAETEFTQIKNLYKFDKFKFLSIFNYNSSINNKLNYKFNRTFFNGLFFNSINYNSFDNYPKTNEKFNIKYFSSLFFSQNFIFSDQLFSKTDIYKKLLTKILKRIN